ncbi:TPA: hypothetical protein MYL16_002133 [Klebsiella pneumoniae]|uniref:hypothetical protein n=1 Tax=Klebsiella pneumoniae TaxID=573 RepID=UPI001CDAF86D|nr:hypothetical protein [Klebsiella pneumoniae]MDG5018638.1 hypothetical protein [Klebsiella pneumoniae]MEA4536448.1 hypothetical protein [Klebsiella pneumoniae]HBR6327540.1 hypothetical protein [Klebsiella pneumoniae]HCA9765438.1 hypothetical protein [Klebsiella pneumoniae]HCB0032433.1 hypothetical protein [Klebsiella pneumoniae]
MDKILDIVNGWIAAAVSSGALSITQVILFLFIAGPLALIIWRIRGVIEFVNEVRNSKLNELQRLLDSHDLSDEITICLKEDIERISCYRLTGIADVPSQKIILRLLVKNKGLIAAGFFKKFNAFLSVKDGVLMFNKGFSFCFFNVVHVLFSLQFISLSILSLILSIYRHEQIPVWGHLILYFVAVIMFLFFIAFTAMIPRPGECKLLNKILQMQHNDLSK